MNKQATDSVPGMGGRRASDALQSLSMAGRGALRDRPLRDVEDLGAGARDAGCGQADRPEPAGREEDRPAPDAALTTGRPAMRPTVGPKLPPANAGDKSLPDQGLRLFGLGLRRDGWFGLFGAAARGRLGAALLLPCFPVKPRRWAFPITAFRVTPPPSLSEIVRAVSPEIHRRFSSSTRGSFQSVVMPDP
jgi:hypothetical protein